MLRPCSRRANVDFCSSGWKGGAIKGRGEGRQRVGRESEEERGMKNTKLEGEWDGDEGEKGWRGEQDGMGGDGEWEEEEGVERVESGTWGDEENTGVSDMDDMDDRIGCAGVDDADADEGGGDDDVDGADMEDDGEMMQEAILGRVKTATVLSL
ncbi:unnamed protein product [Closterium sp. Naga37s-1]|nr:unnamed protein product [Closterium sp. Naga37s-1]